MTPSTVLQCEHCGRVRIDGGDWTRDPLVQVTAVGFCATCGDWQRRLRMVKEAQARRAVVRRMARGYGPAPEGVDVWEGFREPRAEKARG